MLVFMHVCVFVSVTVCICHLQAVLYRLDPKLADTQLETKKALKYQRKVICTHIFV